METLPKKQPVSFSAAINEVEQQQLPISKPDEHALRRSMLHPPRPCRYDLDSLIAFQGICWDISAFVAMELSAIPWLAFVEGGQYVIFTLYGISIHVGP